MEKTIRGMSWFMTLFAAMGLTAAVLFSWSNICLAENSVNNNGVAEVNLTYSHGNTITGGNSAGFAQGKYTGTGAQEVDANANAFADLSGRTNQDNDHPDTQQNSWSRAEINSSATREAGDVSLRASGKAKEGNWALLEKGNRDFAEGGNSFFISYSVQSPVVEPCPPDPCVSCPSQNPKTVSGQGTVFGWTTVQQIENGMSAETYGEGRVGITGSGQTRIKGTGGITAQSFKGEFNGNYSGARAGAGFTIDQQNPDTAKFGHAQGQTLNILEATPYGVYGQSSAQSQAETGNKATNQ